MYYFEYDDQTGKRWQYGLYSSKRQALTQAPYLPANARLFRGSRTMRRYAQWHGTEIKRQQP